MSVIIMIHTVDGCPACSNLKKAANFTKFKDAVLSVDPHARIEIYEHPGWGKMIRQNEYPNFGGITWAPTIMITTPDNMSSRGDPSKIKVFNGRYNPSTKSLVKVESGVGMLEGVPALVRELLASTSAVKPTSIIPPIDNSPPRILPPAVAEEPVYPKEKGKVKCKFVLVSSGNR